jgi:hypothetical protein
MSDLECNQAIQLIERIKGAISCIGTSKEYLHVYRKLYSFIDTLNGEFSSMIRTLYTFEMEIGRNGTFTGEIEDLKVQKYKRLIATIRKCTSSNSSDTNTNNDHTIGAREIKVSREHIVQYKKVCRDIDELRVLMKKIIRRIGEIRNLELVRSTKNDYEIFPKFC